MLSTSSGRFSWILKIAFCAFAVGAFVPLFFSGYSSASRDLHFVVSPSSQPGTDPSPEFFEQFISDVESDTVMVHSSTLTELPNGKLVSVWFQGSREGASDIALYTSTFDPTDRSWSSPAIFIDREHAEREIGRRIKTIGNPVLFTDQEGRTWLFFVTVSFFGWSGGDINFKYSDDDGKTWTPAHRLELSPIPHSGMLVKGSPVEYTDGTLGLPAYRDYDRYSFPEFVRMDRTGGVLSRVPMANGKRGGLQPSMVQFSDSRAVAFLRYNGVDPKRILRVATEDGGQTWSFPVELELPNPDSALAAIRLSNGDVLMAFNNSTEYRNVISLAVSEDEGMNWKVIAAIDEKDDGPNGLKNEHSYPSFLMTHRGEIHLLSTWRRRKIRHVVFNEAWIRSKYE